MNIIERLNEMDREDRDPFIRFIHHTRPFTKLTFKETDRWVKRFYQYATNYQLYEQDFISLIQKEWVMDEKEIQTYFHKCNTNTSLNVVEFILAISILTDKCLYMNQIQLIS